MWSFSVFFPFCIELKMFYFNRLNNTYFCILCFSPNIISSQCCARVQYGSHQSNVAIYILIKNLPHQPHFKSSKPHTASGYCTNIGHFCHCRSSTEQYQLWFSPMLDQTKSPWLNRIHVPSSTYLWTIRDNPPHTRRWDAKHSHSETAQCARGPVWGKWKTSAFVFDRSQISSGQMSLQ